MNAIVEHKPRSITAEMANRYGMEAAPFEATVRATCMRPDKDGRVPSREEFAAFLVVAREYNLNPLTKEIYAYPQRGGGIVPIVSIDGWVNLINSQKAMDGMEFVEHTDKDGNLSAITCRIYRKDRSRPIEVTEHLSECYRGTDPWKMKHRMLRHKALIQCARYAFGFSGIYDEDEGERIIEARDVTPVNQAPAKRVPPPPPTVETVEVIEETATKEARPEAKTPPPPPANDTSREDEADIIQRAKLWGKNCTLDELESYEDEFGQWLDTMSDTGRAALQAVLDETRKRVLKNPLMAG
jgi:phage recombination protein Bet